MTNEKLRPDDTVCLNSGSPIMTIKELTNAGKEAKCVWCNDGAPKEFHFPLECLKISVAPTNMGI